MKSILSVLLVSAGLVACYQTPSADYQAKRDRSAPRDLKNELVLTDELADCKAYQVYNFNGADPIVIRCANSTTITQQAVGKSRLNIITIDGVEYALVPKEAK